MEPHATRFRVVKDLLATYERSATVSRIDATSSDPDRSTRAST